jgi:competence protein ComEA
VTDAVSAAGGVRNRADLTSINLARVVQDGEQIVVPAKGASPGPAPAATAPGGPAVAGETAAVTPVDLNSADVAQLDTLPGIGPVLAARIVDWRTRNGRFTRVEELAEVRGIGEHLLGELRSLVTV